jgi:hypothetical protein
MSSCLEQCELRVIRGDSYTLSVGLDESFSETLGNKHLFVGRLVFREVQDDAAPALLTLKAPLVPAVDPAYKDVIALLHFEATARQTQSLPPCDLVCYCEIAGVEGAYVRRIFQGKVEIGD